MLHRARQFPKPSSILPTVGTGGSQESEKERVPPFIIRSCQILAECPPQLDTNRDNSSFQSGEVDCLPEFGLSRYSWAEDFTYQIKDQFGASFGNWNFYQKEQFSSHTSAVSIRSCPSPVLGSPGTTCPAHPSPALAPPRVLVSVQLNNLSPNTRQHHAGCEVPGRRTPLSAHPTYIRIRHPLRLPFRIQRSSILDVGSVGLENPLIGQSISHYKIAEKLGEGRSYRA